MATPEGERSIAGESETERVLLVGARGRVFALPLLALRETMRPQPVEPLPGSPRGVLGVALIRGATVPVVELGSLVAGDAQPAPPKRFVTLKLVGGDVALAVEDVVGLRSLPRERFAELPPLVSHARAEFVDGVTERDARLLVVLNASRLLPEGVAT